jgi:hypothetical protein
MPTMKRVLVMIEDVFLVQFFFVVGHGGWRNSKKARRPISGPMLILPAFCPISPRRNTSLRIHAVSDKRVQYDTDCY